MPLSIYEAKNVWPLRIGVMLFFFALGCGEIGTGVIPIDNFTLSFVGNMGKAMSILTVATEVTMLNY